MVRESCKQEENSPAGKLAGTGTAGSWFWFPMGNCLWRKVVADLPVLKLELYQPFLFKRGCSTWISKTGRSFGANKDLFCCWGLHQDCHLWGAGSVSQLVVMGKATRWIQPSDALSHTVEMTTHRHWHSRNVGSQFCLCMVAWTDACCTDGACAPCVLVTTPVWSWPQLYKANSFRAARRGSDLCCQSLPQFFSSIFLTPYGVIGNSSCCPNLGTELLPKTAKETMPRTSSWRQPSLVP